MDEEQFILWQSLLEDRTGMQLSNQRKTFLETSLTMRMREIGASSYEEYYERLMSGLAGEVEWATLVDRLTVQETSFFRHNSSYELVEKYCAELLEKANEKLHIDIWSVGCSTGEEPYSLAMLIDDLFLQNTAPHYFGITATDISLPALSKGRQAIYGARKLSLLDAELKARYFEKLDNNRYQVVPKLRERVCFAQVNVRELEKAPMSDMDIIYCQNLLIYFRRWRQREIVSRLVERLAPGGILVLGVGEVIEFEHPLVKRVQYENTLAFTRKMA
ncbi:MAG: protein-glutamate O-methyltransferase CheR [Pseudomonadales bacterium]|nr:protein-glutamate O-methyltransferase CheR [Pseudomonadales bacterium]